MSKCRVQDGILEPERDTSIKTGKIPMKTLSRLIVLYQCSFLGFNKCAMVIYDVNIEKKLNEYIQEVCTIFSTRL